MKSYDILDAYWQDIKDIPVLSDEEERTLAQRIKDGDGKAVEKLVTSNLRFVVSVARQYADKGVNIDDLISEGNLAMMVAAKKWNPKDDGRFVNYAVLDVRRAMEKALPEQGDMMTISAKGSKDAASMIRYSTDSPMRPGQTNTLGDMLKAGKPMTDDETENKELNYSLLRAMSFLNEREKMIVKAFYGIAGSEQLTMAEIAEASGFKRERVRQIRKKAERKMRRAIKALEL